MTTERRTGVPTDEQMQRIVGRFNSVPKELLVSDQWIIQQLAKNALRARKEEPLPFVISSYSVEEHPYHFGERFTLSLDRVVPLIDFIDEFTQTVYNMGIDIPLVSRRICEDRLIDNDDIIKGYLGDSEKDSVPYVWREREDRQLRLQAARDDSIVIYHKPNLALAMLPVTTNELSSEDYEIFYQLERNRRQIIIDPTGLSLDLFTPNQLLQAYILQSLTAQKANA